MIRDDLDFHERPADLDAWLKGELDPGEKVTWVGRPRPARAPFGATSTAWVVAALFAAGPLLGLLGLVGGEPTRPLTLIGMMIATVGLVRLPSAIRSIGAAGGVTYLLTSRRAVVRTPGFGGRAEVESFHPATLGSMIRRERPDGSGDLIFREVAGSGAQRGRIDPRGFLAVDDVRAVERLVRATLLDGRRGP